MLYTVEDDLRLLEELKLTPNQLMFVKLLTPDPTYEDSVARRRTYEFSMRYQKVVGGLSPKELLDLISRDIIVDHNDYGKTLFDYYELNSKFLAKFSLKVYPMPYQLMENYPIRFKGSDGKMYLGITASAEEIAKDYLRAINNSEEEHKKVLQDLEWAKKHEYITLGLKKFVLTKYWLILREQRNKQNITNNVTII